MLRLRRSPRTVRGSLAMSLYVGGGPLAIATVVNLALFGFAYLNYGKGDFSGEELLTPTVLIMGIIAFGSRLAALLIFARALAGLHSVRTGWTAAALLVALMVTGLVFGLLDPPGSYGGHVIIGSEQPDGSRIWWPSYGF
jgi:hypothetical protein